MAVQIALFNHKGGVSKTTTTFNLGWMLASKGKKVIIVDCDPQCNLTGMVLGFKGRDEFDKIYNTKGVTSIKDGLRPAFESLPKMIEPVECTVVDGQPNLLLLPGHIGLAEYEVTLGIAQELSGSIVTLQNLPGSLRYLFNITADKYDADIVLIDMSPSLGAINQNLLMTSDYFIVPMAPDYFSLMAIDSLASILPKWKDWAVKASSMPQLREATYSMPVCFPRFMGTVIQRFRIRERGTPSAAFQKWIDDIYSGLETKMVPMLSSVNMLLPSSCYVDCCGSVSTPLMLMSDFNGLIALSQKHKVPIFYLTDTQLEQTGIVLERTKKSMESFRDIFSAGADKISCIIDYEYSAW